VKLAYNFLAAVGGIPTGHQRPHTKSLLQKFLIGLLPQASIVCSIEAGA
jgi:L-lactate utilization protein LutC